MATVIQLEFDLPALKRLRGWLANETFRQSEPSPANRAIGAKPTPELSLIEMNVKVQAAIDQLEPPQVDEQTLYGLRCSQVSERGWEYLQHLHGIT